MKNINTILNEDMKSIHASLAGKIDSFYESTILITGCAGFLGYYLTNYFTHFSEELKLRRLILLDNFLLGKPDWLEDLGNEYGTKILLRSFDISSDDLSTIPELENVSYVIHAASIASPTYYRKYPIETLNANVWGLKKLLDLYRNSKNLKGFLYFSSSEIYGDPSWDNIPTHEEYRGNVSCHGPRACYDESKRFCETLCWVYSEQYGMPLTVARPFNNYGPGMNIHDLRLPADFAKSVIEGHDLEILSDGSPTRTFCYISDAVTGYLLCLLHGKYNYFNIGNSSPEISVNDFAKIFCKNSLDIFGFEISAKFQKSRDPNYLKDNPNRRCPDVSKALDILGFEAKVSVEDGVSRYLLFLKEEMGL